MMTELQLTRKIRIRLTDPTRWCQGSLFAGDGAVCIVGAGYDIDRVSWKGGAMPLATLLRIVQRRGYPSIVKYNDETDHARVLSALDEAIAILEAAERPATCAAVKKLIDDAVYVPALETV